MDANSLTWLYLPTAFFLGIAHALEPGHSKTIVATYLISIKGKISDAVTLGIVVTITHTSVIFLLAFGVLILGKAFPLQSFRYWLELVSSLLVLVMGLWLLKNRILDYKEEKEHANAHAHGEVHDHHGHSHGLPSGRRLTLRQLFAFGLSGGLVPCPTALAIFILAVGMGKPVLGFVTVVVFSLGLSLALIGIGIAVSQGTGFAESKLSSSGIIKKLPMISSALVALLGLCMLVKTLLGHPYIAGAVIPTK
jgi:nickel/cobalt transporter (NicO) family protein